MSSNRVFLHFRDHAVATKVRLQAVNCINMPTIGKQYCDESQLDLPDYLSDPFG
jgi:hypothetical protein